MTDREFSAPGEEISRPGTEYCPPGRTLQLPPAEFAVRGAESAPAGEYGSGEEERPLKRKQIVRSCRKAFAAVSAAAVVGITVLPSAAPQAHESVSGAQISAEQRAYLDECMEAMIDSDLERLEDLGTGEMGLELVNDVILPYVHPIEEELAGAAYSFYNVTIHERGVPDVYYDGSELSLRFELPKDTPLLRIYQDEDWTLFDLVENSGGTVRHKSLKIGEESQHLLTDKGTTIVTETEWADVVFSLGVPAARPQEWTCAVREHYTHGGMTEYAAECWRSGRFEMVEAVGASRAGYVTDVLADGTASFSYTDEDGQKGFGEARVKDSYTVGWDDSLRFEERGNTGGRIDYDVFLDVGGGASVRFNCYDYWNIRTAPGFRVFFTNSSHDPDDFPYSDLYDGDSLGWGAPLAVPRDPASASGPAETDPGRETEGETRPEFSGTAGSNITWRLSSDGVLELTGSGAMDDYTYDNPAPWNPDVLGIGYSRAVIGDGITSIGEYAFFGGDEMTEVVIPDSISSIGTNAFSGCKNLMRVELPEGLTEIADYTFDDCGNLAEVIIPQSVTRIGMFAFDHCHALTEAELPSGLTELGSYAFRQTGLQFISLPRGLTEIDYYTFSASSLTGIDLPEGIVYIDRGAFEYCRGLKEIRIPDTVTTISDGCFKGCEALTDISLPAGLRYIVNGTFEQCDSLARIHFRGTQEQWDAMEEREIPDGAELILE